MLSQIRVAILDDHQSIIDGYIYRLSTQPEIQIVGTGIWGEELETMLGKSNVDVLLLDANVPVSADNHNPFPILHAIPNLLQQYRELNILVISMLTDHALVEALVDAGISGYVYKDDQASIQQLAKIVMMVANGGVYFSQGAYRELRGAKSAPVLTPRQMDVLSMCAAYPDSDTSFLAEKLGVSNSTLRNLLSGAYVRLGVRTRAAAIAKVHELGLIPYKPRSALVDIKRRSRK